MLRFVLAAALVVPAMPALSELQREESCSYMGEVVRAVQQARLDNVKEADVQKTIQDSNPSWPDNYSNAIPPIADWVYNTIEPATLKKHDLGMAWEENCIVNWDAMQQMLGK